MKDHLENYQKTHDYLLCIDSDGCAIDAMNSKHFTCFGPCVFDVWDIADHEVFLKIWNDVNLYTKTRGINRFKGLALSFQSYTAAGYKFEEFTDLLEWIDHTKELSNASLMREIGKTKSDFLSKVLLWSEKVNEKIKALPEGLPFKNVLETLEVVRESADIVIVSSANKQAIRHEWETSGLSSSVNVLMSQENGSKAECIRQLKAYYESDKIMMIGDALGDAEAAKSNDVWFYPILVNEEEASWCLLKDEIFECFLDGNYGDYQGEFINKIETKLK